MGANAHPCKPCRPACLPRPVPILPFSSSHTLPLLVLPCGPPTAAFPLGGWHPWSTSSCNPLPLVKDMESHLRDNRGPLVVVATSRTITDSGKAGRCLQPEPQKRMGEWGWGGYTAPSPVTSSRGSYLGAGCQTVSWGLGVAGSHGGNRKKRLWGAHKLKGQLLQHFHYAIFLHFFEKE